MNSELIDADEDDLSKHELPKSFRALSTIAYLGNGFWGLIFMIMFFLLVTGSDVLTTAFRIKIENEVIAVFIYLFAMILCVIPIVGIIRMNRKIKAGFVQYLIPNALWVIYCFWLQNPVTIAIGLISAGMIVAFSTYRKYMI